MIVWFAASAMLGSCAIDKGLLWTGVPTALQEEIKVALRKVTSSPVDGIQHNTDWPSNEYLVSTVDGKYWHAIKWRGLWYFKEAVLSVDADDLTKRSSQPLAVPMSSFHMTSTLNSVAMLALASGG